MALNSACLRQAKILGVALLRGASQLLQFD
jgi:hypothetical protein